MKANSLLIPPKAVVLNLFSPNYPMSAS